MDMSAPGGKKKKASAKDRTLTELSGPTPELWTEAEEVKKILFSPERGFPVPTIPLPHLPPHKPDLRLGSPSE